MLSSVWYALTEAQATIIAAVLTICAAVVGVALGSKLFGRQIANLEAAMQTTEDLVIQHRSTMKDEIDKLNVHFEKSMLSIRDQIDSVSVQVASSLESLAKVRSDISDQQSVPSSATVPDSTVDAWEQLRDDWKRVRDELERRAASPAVDGRTRAKYGRMDRRKYGDLIDCMEDDETLDSDGSDFREANAIWQRFKSGRLEPSSEDLRRMNYLRERVTRAQT